MREIYFKYQKKIKIAAVIAGTAAVGLYGACHPTHESLTFKGGVLPIPTPTSIANPRLEVSALCQPPGKYGEKRLPWHIHLNIRGMDIDTGKDGVWTIINNLNSGKSAITSYTGNNRTAIYSGENHEGFINIIRTSQAEFKRPWIYTGTPYSVQIREGAYTDRIPDFGKVVVETNITTPKCP